MDTMIDHATEVVARVRTAMATRLVGRQDLVDAILIAIVSEGHILLEGVPGLAKTLAVRTFADVCGLAFRRIQFTPDLLPGDVTGTLFYDSRSGDFVPRRGPVFANIVLADEINRAPAKVQSALLEAMEERQVTMGDQSLRLPEPFFVMATQNPVEHEGTFRLPEAQLDRFMMKVVLGYPDIDDELEVLRRYAPVAVDGAGAGQAGSAGAGSVDALPAGMARAPVIGQKEIDILRKAVATVRFGDGLAAYALAIVRATRPGLAGKDAPRQLRDIERHIEFGASPRATIALCRAARAGAMLAGRDHTLPEDIKKAAMPVLRHRIIPSYEADAERLGVDTIIGSVLSAVPVP